MFQHLRIRKAAIGLAMEQSSFTRSDLARKTGVRPATVIEVVRGLLAEGLLEEPDRTEGARTGRKASRLCIRPTHSRFAGFALTTESLQAVLIDASGAVLARRKISWNRPPAADFVLKTTADLVGRLGKESGEEVARVLGAGFADPGLVDESAGVAIRAVNLPGWQNVAVGQELGKRLGCPVLVRAEMSARALAERTIERIDPGRGCIHLNVGEGIGAAYSRGFEIFTGDNCCQMEIGHVVVEEDGQLCTCGNRGCLEAYAGRRGLAQRVRQLKSEGVSSALAGAPFTLQTFIDAVASQDKAAMRISLDAFAKIGQALASACSLLNPRTVSLSGPVFSLWDTVMPVLRQSVLMRCLPQTSSGLVWRRSLLGDEAPALGAALAARRLVLSNLAGKQTSRRAKTPVRPGGRRRRPAGKAGRGS